MLKSLLLIVFAGLCSVISSSQVNNLLHFESPGFYLMPSEIGIHEDKWVLGSYMNTKNIVSNIPVRSYAISGDFQLIRGFQSLYVGLGLADVSLLSTPYHESEFYGTVAFHKRIRNHSFHIGVQPGLVLRNLDTDQLLFPDQYDRNTGSFNASLGTNEPIAFSGKAMQINLNVGLAYGIKISKYANRFVLAYRNINKPNISFGDAPILINRQLIIQNKTAFYVTHVDQIKAFVMVRSMSEKTETFAGGEWVHNLMKHQLIMNEIKAGGYVALRNGRYPNTLVLNLGFGIQNLMIGLAYSYNFIGNKGASSDFNAFELVLVLKGLNNTLDTYRVPCEIY